VGPMADLDGCGEEKIARIYYGSKHSARSKLLNSLRSLNP
jgi:hypothetical protein